jgi:TRAP-type C4-dicarboxylate transport system permease small subunit
MRRFLAWTENVAAFFLLAIAVMTAANVVLRYVFALQIPDNFDFSKLLQGIALFWGIAVATYYGGHICVDIVWEGLGPRGRRGLDIVATLLTLTLLAPMAWMAWVKVFTTGTQATSDLRIPLAPFYAVAALGATAAAILALKRIVDLRNSSLSAPGAQAEEAPHGS